MNNNAHIPVLLEEVKKLALPDSGKIFVDGTFGLGGHSNSILAQYPELETLIAIDQDAEILELSRETCTDPRVKRFHSRASNLPQVLALAEITGVDGILLDLGVSSFQLDNAHRGFSFSNPGPIDMRMDKDNPNTAAELVNNLGKFELMKIFRDFGEEKFSGRIADAIILERSKTEFKTTDHLANVVREAIPAKFRYKMTIHPATKVFQALRIAVNHELEELTNFLEIALECLNPGGHLSIISFHSLEDRIVKNHMKELSRGCTCPPVFPVCICHKKPKIEVLTRKAVFATQNEIDINPRSRSARLRTARKCPLQDE